MPEKIKIAFSLLLVVLGGVGFYLLEGQMSGLRWLAVIAGLLLGLLVFCGTTESGARLLLLRRDAWEEVRKIVWPDRKETMQLTLMVFGFVLLIALFLFLSDKMLEWVMYDLILGWKQ